jgi:hypothetical protein
MKRLMLLLLLVPTVLMAQAPKKARGLKARQAAVNLLADSAGFKFELGSDVNALQSGDSLPADVRAGFVIGQRASIEASVAAKSDSGYTEYEATFGPTIAIFPGATTFHGQYVYAAGVYHNDGNAHQFGIKFGTGNREVAVNGLSVRMSGFVERLFANGALVADTRVGTSIGISIWN